MASYVTAKKNTAWIGYIRLSPRAGIGTFQNNPTLAAGDVKVSIDGGALANLTTLPVVTPASSDWVKVSLSAGEMNGDNIAVQFKDAAGNEWCDDGFLIQTTARQIDDLAYPATSGRSIVVDAAGLVDANAVKVGPTGAGTAQTARDLGASVIIGGALAATGLGAVRSGTAQAGAVGQITLDSGASSVDNFYRGLGCYIVGGTGAGQTGVIYGYTGSTKVALISPQWRTAPDSTSVFVLQPTPGVNVEMWRTSQANAAVSGRPDVYVGAMATAVVDATAIATDAIGSAELAASAATKIRDTIISDATAFAGASIAAIKAKTDNLPASPAATSDIPTANIAAIKAKTDSLAFTVAGMVDANVVDWKGATAPAMTGDAYARLGAPAGASVSADVAAVKVDTAAIKAKTDNLPSDPADASDVAAAITAVQNHGDTYWLTANLSGVLSILGSPSTGTIPGDIAASYGGVIAKVDAVPAAVFAVNIDGHHFSEHAAGWSAVLMGKVSGGQTGTEAFRAIDDSKARVTSTNDAQGNRTAVTLDLG